MMISKPKKSSRKKLVKLCDKEMSLYVRERDKRCVLCGKTNQLTCGHLLTRRNYSTRWDFGNCFCQCSGCNYRHEFNAAPFTLWFIHKFGLSTYEDLEARHNGIVKLKEADLEGILRQIKAKRERQRLLAENYPKTDISNG